MSSDIVPFCQHAQSYYNCGLAFEHLGDFNKAIEYYQKAVNIDGGYIEAYNNLGVAYGKAGIYRQAVYNLRKAITLDPFHAKAHSNLGYVYSLEGDKNKAIEYLKKAAQLFDQQGAKGLSDDARKFISQLE